MKTNIEFISAQFPTEPNEVDLVNPERYGKKLSDFISSHLPSYGFSVKKTLPEDWGWVIQIENNDYSLWVGCGNYEEFENGFLCFIEPSKPFVRKWFKKIDTRPVVEKLASSLESIINLPAAGATKVRWWSENEK